MSDKMKIKGHVKIEVSDGSIIEQKNVVVNLGINRFAALIAQDSSAFPSHIAIGTDATAALPTDVSLGAEVDRNAIVQDFAAGAVATFRAFFDKTEANGNTIAEVGMFDQASGGTMFCRSILSSTIAKDATKSITITWTLTFADA